MRNIIHNKNFYLVLLLDSFLIVAAYFLAYLLRFEGQIPIEEWKSLTATLPYIVPFKLSVFMFFGLYKGMWRYTSLVDLFNILKGTIISSGIVMIAILFIYRFEGFPRSVFVLDWILTFIFIGGVRITIRLLLSERERELKFLFQNPFSKRRTIRPKRGY